MITMMRQIRCLSMLALCGITTALAQQNNVPRLGTDKPILNYKEVPNWPTPFMNAAGTPAPWNFIQVSGVAVDSRGHILVLHRGAQALLDFERFDHIVSFSSKKPSITSDSHPA